MLCKYILIYKLDPFGQIAFVKFRRILNHLIAIQGSTKTESSQLTGGTYGAFPQHSSSTTRLDRASSTITVEYFLNVDRIVIEWPHETAITLLYDTNT